MSAQKSWEYKIDCTSIMSVLRYDCESFICKMEKSCIWWAQSGVGGRCITHERPDEGTTHWQHSIHNCPCGHFYCLRNPTHARSKVELFFLASLIWMSWQGLVKAAFRSHERKFAPQFLTWICKETRTMDPVQNFVSTFTCLLIRSQAAWPIHS